MTMREDLYFVYNGIPSIDMGVLSVNMDGGMLEESFMPERKINEVSIKGRERPYFMGVEYEPLPIPLTLAFKDGFTDEEAERVARWLSQPYYRELYFSNNPQKRFYAMYNGSPSLIHNGAKQGYVTIEMRNIDCYRYSPVYQSHIYDYSKNTDGVLCKFENEGSVNIFPNLEVEKVEDGEIKIINLSNGGQEFILTDLVDGEKLVIDMEEGSIETNLKGTIRYKNHNNVFLEMVEGINYLMVYGKCNLRWEYQFKYLS